tara:strand:- start:1337 stop:1657 length:321 start_codon:yes stop_codon:yes gene_type:complete
MIEKSIIDANSSIRRLARLVGVNYDQLGNGEKITVSAEYIDGTETTLSFYKTKRGDRRFSCKGINKKAAIGDTVAVALRVSPKNDDVVVINVSENQEYAPLVSEVS